MTLCFRQSEPALRQLDKLSREVIQSFSFLSSLSVALNSSKWRGRRPEGWGGADWRGCGVSERQSMVCAPVRRDNPRAIARGLSTVQAHKLCSISLVPQ